MSLDGQRPTRAPEWVSIHEAALLMGVSPATLRRWSDAGDIRTFTTPGGHRRFSRTVIAGLLPDIGPATASPDQMLGRVQARTERVVARTLERTDHGPSTSVRLGHGDRATALEAIGSVVAGVLTSLEPDRGLRSEAALAEARPAALACGVMASEHGLDVGQTVAAWSALRRIVTRGLAASGRRHDLDGPTATRWLERASRGLDLMLDDVIRGHGSAAATSSSNSTTRRTA